MQTFTPASASCLDFGKPVISWRYLQARTPPPDAAEAFCDRPVVLEAAVASEDPPNDAIADQRFHLYGARGNLLCEMLAARLQADRLFAGAFSAT
jgi:hypothetical protein